jgi:hypothetical protein
MPDPERVSGILDCVESGTLGELLHHTRYVDAREPFRLHLPMPVD